MVTEVEGVGPGEGDRAGLEVDLARVTTERDQLRAERDRYRAQLAEAAASLAAAAREKQDGTAKLAMVAESLVRDRRTREALADRVTARETQRDAAPAKHPAARHENAETVAQRDAADGALADVTRDRDRYRNDLAAARAERDLLDVAHRDAMTALVQADADLDAVRAAIPGAIEGPSLAARVGFLGERAVEARARLSEVAEALPELVGSGLSLAERVAWLVNDREQLQAQLAAAQAQPAGAALRAVYAAAKAMLPDWRDTSGSFVRVDAMNEHCDAIAKAVDAAESAVAAVPSVDSELTAALSDLAALVGILRQQGGYLPPGDQLALRAAMARLAQHGRSVDEPPAGRSPR